MGADTHLHPLLCFISFPITERVYSTANPTNVSTSFHCPLYKRTIQARKNSTKSERNTKQIEGEIWVRN